MTVYPWPGSFHPRGVSFKRRGVSVAGQPSMTGRMQVGQLDAGYWVASYSRLNVGGAAPVKAYRAFMGRMEGGAHSVLVPVYDDAQAPWPLAGGSAANLNTDEPFDDGLFFDDGTGFFDPSILVTLSAAAALRATAIDVTVGTAGTISGGEYFSIGDRLHVITDVISSTRWAIWPPLREAAAVGAELNFDRPICRMTLVDEATGDLTLERGLYGYPDLEFVEVV